MTFAAIMRADDGKIRSTMDLPPWQAKRALFVVEYADFEERHRAADVIREIALALRARRPTATQRALVSALPYVGQMKTRHRQALPVRALCPFLGPAYGTTIAKAALRLMQGRK